MPVRFSVLGSGSSGNSSLLEVDGFGLLIDAGLGPRQIGSRLAEIDSSWDCIHAAILTHIHGDHWNERTVSFLQRRGLPLYCHVDHHTILADACEAFVALAEDGLVRTYRHAEPLMLSAALRCWPLVLRHDCGATFGFRFEGTFDDASWALAYLADLGSWTPKLADSLADVDVLALEFNHDVALQYASGRSPRLIARVLGDAGHLSNVQAAKLVNEIVRRSSPGRMRHLVQLHLSRDCNRPELALQAAQSALNGCKGAVEIHSTSQDCLGPCLIVEPSESVCRSGLQMLGAAIERLRQPWLPGCEPYSEAATGAVS
jgi:hypothetical protein